MTPMTAFDLEYLLQSAGRRMRDDLAERLVPHPGELGTGREEIIRAFLRAYLPNRFEVATGFAFDACGSVSEQLDIIIANSLVCPRFETAGGKRFYPCESIVAVGQVKSSLTTKQAFRDAMRNLASVKLLRSLSPRTCDRQQVRRKDRSPQQPLASDLHLCLHHWKGVRAGQDADPHR